MSEDVDEFGGGSPALKFLDVGTSWTITVTGSSVSQQTDFDSGALLFWEDGKPRNQLIVTGDLDEDDREDDDDDGERRMFIKSGLVKAFREAMRDAKTKPSQMKGGRLTMTYVEDGAKPKRGYPPKIYKAEFVPAAAKPLPRSADDEFGGSDEDERPEVESKSRSVQHRGADAKPAGSARGARGGTATKTRTKAAAPAAEDDDDEEPPF